MLINAHMGKVNNRRSRFCDFIVPVFLTGKRDFDQVFAKVVQAGFLLNMHTYSNIFIHFQIRKRAKLSETRSQLYRKL